MPDVSNIFYALALLAIGAGLKAVADIVIARMGWQREDTKADRQKIERVDQHARNELSRVEKELGDKVGSIDRRLSDDLSALKAEQGRLAEHVKHLPTDEDIQGLRDGQARLERETAAGFTRLERDMGTALARIEGQTDMVRTIRDHMMERDR